jgi:hypothetical protein
MAGFQHANEITIYYNRPPALAPLAIRNKFRSKAKEPLKAEYAEVSYHREGLAIKTVTKLVDGNYPNYRMVVPDPKEFKFSLRFDPAIAEAALRTYAKFAAKAKTYGKIDSIGLRLGKNCFAIGQFHGSEDPLPRTVHTAIQKGFAPASFKIGFNPLFAAEALACGFDTIHFRDHESPMVFRHPNRHNEQTILMPVRISTPAAPPVPEVKPAEPVAEPVAA